MENYRVGMVKEATINGVDILPGSVIDGRTVTALMTNSVKEPEIILSLSTDTTPHVVEYRRYGNNEIERLLFDVPQPPEQTPTVE